MLEMNIVCGLLLLPLLIEVQRWCSLRDNDYLSYVQFIHYIIRRYE